jgi:hypothetical protein
MLSGCLLVSLLSGASPALADPDEFSDQRTPPQFVLRSEHLTLTLKGEIEVEFHDIAGSGGPGFDSPTDTITLGTRSPFFEMDAFALALRLGFSDAVQVNSVLEFFTEGARLGAIWADFRARGPDWLEHHVEAGYHLPIVSLDRRTERYPLLATSFWREPEMHLAWVGRVLPEGPVTIALGASIAMMRPLTLLGIQDSTQHPGTLNVLASGPAETFSGNGPVGGGRIRITAFGVFLDAFGFIGELADEGGTDVLRSAFSRYRNLPGYDSETGGKRNFHWAGGRIGYSAHGLHAWAEGVASREGLLERGGLYAQASVEIPLGSEVLFHTLEPLVRWERSWIQGSAEILDNGLALRSPALIDAVAWDWEVWTFALMLDLYRQFAKLRVEYALIDEDNGVPALGIPSEPFLNDELTVQLELRF